VSGEETQAKGADGARRAKLWLESTTRVDVHWVNPEPIAIPKLKFKWANDQTFSFDMGGVLRGEELDGQEFLAECKKYKDAQDQGKHYKKFLAQCYRAFTARPERCDNFIWITWAPFNVTTWSKLLSPEEVRAAVLAVPSLSLGAEDPEHAQEMFSDEDCKEVADRLRMIVLSDWQERLTPTIEHLALIRSFRTQRGA
jgi:hypothetical protein